MSSVGRRHRGLAGAILALLVDVATLNSKKQTLSDRCKTMLNHDANEHPFHQMMVYDHPEPIVHGYLLRSAQGASWPQLFWRFNQTYQTILTHLEHDACNPPRISSVSSNCTALWPVTMKPSWINDDSIIDPVEFFLDSNSGQHKLWLPRVAFAVHGE